MVDFINKEREEVKSNDNVLYKLNYFIKFIAETGFGRSHYEQGKYYQLYYYNGYVGGFEITDMVSLTSCFKYPHMWDFSSIIQGVDDPLLKPTPSLWQVHLPETSNVVAI